MIIQYEKTYQGAHRFYAMRGDYLFTMQYFFCSKREALAMFKQELRGA
jgi:hypothetical protein